MINYISETEGPSVDWLIEGINLYRNKLETCHKLIDYLLITRHKRPLSHISAYTYTHNIHTPVVIIASILYKLVVPDNFCLFYNWVQDFAKMQIFLKIAHEDFCTMGEHAILNSSRGYLPIPLFFYTPPTPPCTFFENVFEYIFITFYSIHFNEYFNIFSSKQTPNL